uniref:Uncharacterized protein n=1 Tax=Ananas comosus var. bracteatus TaxID=296719 RepID=A0A6V7PI18_ANACO|nr:unnamed protein product [Ananas comosus var. bracteatus]
MLSEARGLPCFQVVFDVATFESSIGSVKLDLEYFKYSRSSLTEPIDDSKVATSKTSWKHGRLRASDSIISTRRGSLPIAEVAVCCCGADSRGGAQLRGVAFCGTERSERRREGGLSLTATHLAGTRPPSPSASEPFLDPLTPGPIRTRHVARHVPFVGPRGR